MNSIALIQEIFSGVHEISDSEIIELISVLKKELDLYDYIKTIDIVDYSKKGEGRYLPNEKYLMISPRKIYEDFLRWVRQNNYPINARAISRQFNLFVLITIYHEISHVLQDKKDIEQREYDSRGILLHETIEFGRRLPNQVSTYEKFLYKTFYKLMLMERNAETESLYTILTLDDQHEFLNDRERHFIIKELLKNFSEYYIENKNGIICPAKIYYYLRLKKREFNNIPFTEEYDNFTKLSWGMPISKELQESLFRGFQTTENIKQLLKSK